MPQSREQRREQSKKLMQALRDKRREVKAGIVSSPITGEVRPRDTMVLTELAKGKTVSEALATAGFRARSSVMRARLKEGGDLRASFRKMLIANGETGERVTQTIVETLGATKVVGVSKEGITEHPDHQARLAAARLAREDQERAGMIPGAEEAESGPQLVAVNITITGSQAPTQPIQVVTSPR